MCEPIYEQKSCLFSTLGELAIKSHIILKFAVIGPDQYIKDFLKLIGIKDFEKKTHYISTYKTNVIFITHPTLFVYIDAAIILDKHHSHFQGTVPPSLQSIKHSNYFLTKNPYTPIIYVRISHKNDTCTSVAINKIFNKMHKCSTAININKLRKCYYKMSTSDWNSIICVNAKNLKSNIINKLCCPIRIYNLCKLCATTTYLL